jgi:NADPH-dependent 2,4-dienoyl-CoA reductase/sulfur reductase-like enzyme
MIGCGPAAISALRQMRRLGSEDEVKLISMEDCPPYSPMSLPYLISGRVKETDIRLTHNGFFQEMNATLLSGIRVHGVDTRGKRVLLGNGRSESYDSLLIATGSEPATRPVLKEARVPGFHILDDCARFKGLKERTRVAILGAGFVGLELAAALAEKGHEVSVVAPRERVLRRYLDAEVDHYIIDLLSAHGVSVQLSWGEAIEVRREGEGFKATFASGRVIETQMLIAATGVVPRVSYLDGSAIEIRQGIVVDRTMRTNVPDVFAAGDVAEAPDFLTGEHGLSLIQPTAVEEGKVAGSNMAGKNAVFGGSLSMNVFNFFGQMAVSLGASAPSEGDELLEENDTADGRYKKLICRKGRLVGANFFNVDVDAGVLNYLIRKRIDLGPHAELLLSRPKTVGLWLMIEAEKTGTTPLEA